MINKMILPLLTTTLIFLGAETSFSMEGQQSDKDPRTTAMSTTNSLTSLSLSDETNKSSLWLTQERKIAKLLPQDERNLDALLSYVGGEWDPEGPINYVGMEQKAILVSKLEEKLEKLTIKMRTDPLLNGHNPEPRGESLYPLIPSSSLPVPESHAKEVKRYVPEQFREMPKYNTDDKLPLEMLQHCFDVRYMAVVERDGLEKVTVTLMLEGLINHSLDNEKEWPVEILEVIAKNTIDRMPIYDEQHFIKEGVPDEMVRYCYEVSYPNLVRSTQNGMLGVTAETLTTSLINHSKLYDKGWPEHILGRIAGHIVDLDDIDPMPRYDNEDKPTHEMILYCIQERYQSLLGRVKLKDITVDLFTQELINHSRTHEKGWPPEMLKEIASRILNIGESDVKQEQKDANKGDPDKK